MASHAPAVTSPPLGDLVLQSCPDGLWVLDAAGSTTFANDRAGELLGLPAPELLGRTLAEVLDDDAREGIERQVARLAAAAPGSATPAGPTGEHLCSLRGPGGSHARVQVASSALRDQTGGFRGWLHRMREVGIDAAAPDVQEIAAIGRWEWDLPSDRLWWSEELFRVCGFDPATYEPDQETYLARVHRDDRDRLLGTVAEAIASGGKFEVDYRHFDDGNRTRWLRGRGVAVQDTAGQVVGLAGTSQDITEIKEQGNALAFLSAMAAAANQAHTLQEVLLAAEEKVRPYAQWPAVVVSVPARPDGSELVHIDLAWADSVPGLKDRAREVAQRAADERRTVELPGPDGAILMGGPVISGGRLACVLVSDTGNKHDPSTSDRGVFSQILVLLSHVAEREWAAVELEAARDQALDASRAKSDFLATMSHEIRTPLNGVIGLSELLGSTDLTPHQHRLTQGIDQAGRTLLALVNDILDLSKIEAGRMDLEEVDFDPRQVVEHSVALVADTAREKGLELVVSSSADVPELVSGDPVRFGQVVTNLAANAVKFTSVGEVHVRSTATPAADGWTVLVEVSDTGIGVAPENQGRLFEAFSQADSSTTREYGGTGLGLAISTRIVSAMHGDIGLRSELGAGSTFWFTGVLGAPVNAPPAEEEALRLVAGLRVLVVDDNQTNRYILSEKLDAWRIEAHAVESAYEALVELDAASRRGLPYDIALLDYMMPGADGEQLARIVRAEARHDRTRLVLLSSGLQPAEEFLTAAGIDVFLSKPVIGAQLLDTLASLGGRGRVEPVPDPHAPAVRVGSRGRVLVVEDNSVNQLVAEGVLQRLGYTVVIAEDGAVAVSTLAEDALGFDAVLMDSQMPVLDGYDATRAIRADEAVGSRIPIIAMTASVVAEERDRCLAAGMDDFLPKPIDIALLARTLDRFVPAPSALVDPTSAEPRVPRGGFREVTAARVGRSGGSPGSAGIASSVAAHADVLDRGRLLELLEDGAADLALVLRILNRFGGRAGELAVDLGEAVRGNDPAEVARLAHALRGSAANVGLVRLAALGEDVELLGSAGSVPPPEVLAEVVDEVALGVRALHDFARHLIREAAAATELSG